MKKLLKSCVVLFLLVTMITGCTNNEGKNQNSAEDKQQSVGMRDITSQQLVDEMTFGWNLGNTLDVCQADRDGNGSVNESAGKGKKVEETLWGNPKATKELFESLKKDGINAVRLPVTWRDHLDENNKVDPVWMDRVQEVVNYAYDLGMYVIINVHHDGGGDPQFGAWLRNAATDKETVLKKYKTVWTQVVERFKDYSDHLIFEAMNEVGFDNLPKQQAFDLLLEFNQSFVDLVRSSGGSNGKRHLLVAGYWTDIKETTSSLYKMPKDSENRLILSIHYYTPWQFCTTNMQHEWGSSSEVSTMESLFKSLKTTYVEKGIPVIIGEYGTGPNDKESCSFFIEKLVKTCKDYGIAPFYWDNGEQVDRKTYKWRAPEYLEAMKKASSGEKYEVKKGKS